MLAKANISASNCVYKNLKSTHNWNHKTTTLGTRKAKYIICDIGKDKNVHKDAVSTG